MFKEEVIELAIKLISFKTITPYDDGIADFIVEYLSASGFKADKLVFSDVTNLYLKFGDSAPNFCFAGHTDVVPPG